MPDTSDVLLRKVPTNFVENFQNKATLAEKSRFLDKLGIFVN